MDGDRGVRISDADRERAAQRLQTAMVEGRITVLELDQRLGEVYAARYEDELRAPLVDLPPLPDTAQPGRSPAVLPHPGSLDPAGEQVVVRSGMDDIKRRGHWVVPARLRLHSPVGSVVLDFCGTEVPHPVVDVELHLAMGSARLLVPEGATADVDGVMAGLGSARVKGLVAPRPGATHYRVHGNVRMGSVTVRHPRRLGRWTF